jgi:hypothetical protein
MGIFDRTQYSVAPGTRLQRRFPIPLRLPILRGRMNWKRHRLPVRGHQCPTRFPNVLQLSPILRQARPQESPDDSWIGESRSYTS